MKKLLRKGVCEINHENHAVSAWVSEWTQPVPPLPPFPPFPPFPPRSIFDSFFFICVFFECEKYLNFFQRLLAKPEPIILR